MIFMTSNLGASEMEAMMRPRLGFTACHEDGERAEGAPTQAISAKIVRAGVEAMRRKFTPEFVNRIDKIAVFRPLGHDELDRILGLELHQIERRILESTGGTPFVFHLSAEARSYLLREGTDMKYGARHLKRAIDRTVVNALSNLVASGQILRGDLVLVDYDPEDKSLTFIKEAEQVPAFVMSRIAKAPNSEERTAAAEALAELALPTKAAANR